MSNLDQSIAGLVKFNNGSFKSDKQAQLFLNKAIDGVYYTQGGSVHGNGFRHAYHINQDGVYKVEKITRKGDTTTWTKDTTDAWKAANDVRNERKQLAAWLNKAQAIHNEYEQTIVPMAMKDGNQNRVIARAERLKELQSQIDAVRKRFDNMPTK